MENIIFQKEKDLSEIQNELYQLIKNSYRTNKRMPTQTFKQKLQDLINCCSLENRSDTPDFILAEYLNNCLINFDIAVNQRNDWHIRNSMSMDKRIMVENESPTK